jgi:hypothetical protein
MTFGRARVSARNGDSAIVAMAKITGRLRLAMLAVSLRHCSSVPSTRSAPCASERTGRAVLPTTLPVSANAVAPASVQPVRSTKVPVATWVAG